MRGFSKRIFARSQILQMMPYLTSELSTICSSCVTHSCLDSCPENIIVLTPDGFPTLCFEESGCIFCQKCVQACYQSNGEHGGFDLSKEEVNMRAEIDPNGCLAWNKSICLSCKDICPCKIEFMGMFYPEIVSCNGCGLCLSRCPTEAIRIKPYQKEEK